MNLTSQQQALLDGAKGPAMAKVVKTLVMYGECFGAERMVPVTGANGHLVTSFGLSMLGPVYDLMDELLKDGALSGQSFSVDPRPLDPAVPANPLQKLLFKIMYSKQDDYEAQLRSMGLLDNDAFTCTCYQPEVGNRPRRGDILSWAESSAVVFANSVLGARCNRNSGIIEMFGSIAGFVPEFGLLTDEGRKATWIIEVDCKRKPEAQVLGSAIGMKVMEDVPYIKGLDRWLGRELTPGTQDYLKDMGAASASNGAVGLYHVDGITPEAVEQGEHLIALDAQIYRRRRAGTHPLELPRYVEEPGRTPQACLHRLPPPLVCTTRPLGRRHLRWAERLRQVPRASTHRTDRRPIRGRRLPQDCGIQTPLDYRCRRLEHLPAYVHQQPALRQHAHHHQLQQVAYVLGIALLHRRRGARLRHHRKTNQIGRRLLMEKIFHGRVVVPGTAHAKALVSHGGLNTLASFQKALMFGDKKATCSDQNNPDLYGKPLAGCALCLPQTIGSTTGGMVLFCATKMGRQPACLLFSKPIDSLAAAGAILSGVWTDTPMPTIDNLGDEFLDAVSTGDAITVTEDGTVIVG